MSAVEFLSGLQHGDPNAAYSYKGVAGPVSEEFEGPSMGNPAKEGVGQAAASPGQSANKTTGNLAQV